MIADNVEEKPYKMINGTTNKTKAEIGAVTMIESINNTSNRPINHFKNAL